MSTLCEILYNEDIYTRNSPLAIEVIKTNDLGYTTEVNVDIDTNCLGEGYLSSRSMLSVSSCGICGKRELGDLTIKGEAANNEAEKKFNVVTTTPSTSAAANVGAEANGDANPMPR